MNTYDQTKMGDPASHTTPKIAASSPWRNWLPTAIAVAVLLTFCGFIARRSLILNGGHWIYAMDDPYIHMAIAKNLALHHVYGVTRYETSMASSSIVWPWLLAACYVAVGVNDYTPYIVNIVCAVALVVAAAGILRSASRERSAVPLQTIALLCLVLIAPLPTMCQIGMEHIAHALAMLGLLYFASRYLETASSHKLLAPLLALAFLCTSLRYEGAFLVLAVAVLLIATRKYREAVLVALTGAAPILVYGVVSVLHGQYFFPNSVLVKTNRHSHRGSILDHLTTIAHQDPTLLVIGLAALALALLTIKRRADFGWTWHALVLFVAVWCMHVYSIDNYFFYRYQAYLIVLGVVTISAFACRYAALAPAASPDGLIAALAIALGTLLFNPNKVIHDTIWATSDIYRQQYLDAQFVKARYNRGTIFLNDIGAVAFYTDARLIDYAGLATRDFTTMAMNNTASPKTTYDYVMSHKATLGIVYSEWLPGGYPGWTIVADRYIEPNVVCAFDAVSFVAFRHEDVAPLAASVKLYFDIADPDGQPAVAIPMLKREYGR